MSLTMDIVDTFDMSKQKPAYVTFDTRAVESVKQSEAKGHWVGKEKDFATVRQPGSADSMIWEVEKWFSQNEIEVKAGRLHPEHAKYYRKAYQSWKEGQEIPVDGTPIKTWPVLGPAQVNLLSSLHIRTVEELAALPDDGVKRIGMGGIDMKNKAKAWLAAANDKGKVTNEVAALKQKNSVLEGSVETLTKQVKDLEALVRAQQTVTKNENTIDITDEDFEEPKKKR